MSGARRKAKHPQKWEESLGQDISVPNRPSSLEKSEHDSHGSSRGNPSPGNIYDKNLMRSFSPSFFGHSKTSLKNEGGMNSKTKPKYGVEDWSQEGSSEEEGDLNARETRPSEGEMTVLDVLQGSRQGLVAECRTCSIQLKDWISTVGHIQSHRLSFIPLCVKDSENSSLKQSVTCLVCQKPCLNLSVLAAHARTEHSLNKSPSVCPFCGRVFPSASLLQKHVDVRNVCLKCPVCSAVYDQEYELYSHLSDCLPTFHPHIKNLVCHVCNQRLPMASLADHMINHSANSHGGRSAKLQRKSGSSPKHLHSQALPPIMSSSFLCEICDRRFGASRFEDFRRHLYEHTETKIFCPLCLLKGFEKRELILRHLILRCPKRSTEQFEFGYMLSLIGKEKRMSFLQLLKFVQHLQPFMEGFSAWNSIPLVQEVLKNIGNIRIEDPPPGESSTDIELLLWLSDFEREFQNPHSEIHNWLNRKEPLAPPEVKDMPEPSHPSMMESLPVDVASSKPLSHRISASDIRKNYPGVRLLPKMDLKRLKVLYDEAMSYLEKDLVAAQIENGTFSSSHFDRLEWEAQYLRGKEPFYLPSLEDQKLFCPSYKKLRHSSPCSKAKLDPDVMARIKKEVDEMQDEKLTPFKNSLVDPVKLSALLQEAKEG